MTSENIVTGEKIWVYTTQLKGAEPEHCHKNVSKGKYHILSVKADQLFLSEKVTMDKNSFVQSTAKLEGLYIWKNMAENNENKCLQQQLGLEESQKSNFHRWNNQCSEKVPVDIFDIVQIFLIFITGVFHQRDHKLCRSCS